jgi:chaperonin GroES
MAKAAPVIKVIDYKPVVLGDRVLIRPVASEQRGLLYRPETVVTQEGIVLAVGPGAWQYGVFVSVGLQVGQRVIYGRYSGHEVEVNGERLWSLRESEVHLILEPI